MTAEPSIVRRFEEIAALHPNRIAVSTNADRWSYAELDRRATTVASRILECHGAKPSPVALLMEQGAPLTAAILGALKAGKIYVALDAGDSPTRLTTTLADSGAELLVTDAANAAMASSLVSEKLRVLGLADPCAPGAANVTLPEVSARAGAWLMYTSGSTGKSKGVWQDHASALRQAAVYQDLIQLTPDDRVALLTSCSLAASTSPFFVALLNGATLCPFHVRSQGVERLAEWMREQRITIYHSVPAVFRQLARVAGGRCFETVRMIRLGGDPVLREDLELFHRHAPDGCRLMQSLSSSETGLIAAMMIGRGEVLTNGRLPVGRSVPGVEILLTDDQGAPVNSGSEGRIAVRSASMRQGYWKKPELTAQKFRPDAHDPRCRVFISDDLGRWLPDGSLEHLGRVDRVVKVRGLRADLDEIEAALRATNLFTAAAVVASPAPTGEVRIGAYIVPRTGTEISPAAWRRALRCLPEHMMPSDFIPLDRLPQTAGGKVDRIALTQFSPDKNPSPRNGSAPRDGIERKIAAIWESILRISPIGRSDDFFDLGGTSLESAQVLARIEQSFNVTLAPSTLLEHSTVATLAELLAQHTVARASGSLVLLRTGAAGPPLFLIHNGKGDLSSYGPLTRRLGDRPVYGFQSPGLNGESWPETSVTRMAERYVRELMTVHTGPYCLAGTCMGGLVAFEMAQQLQRLGKSVPFVALIDSATPPFSGRRAHWHEQFLDPLRDGLRILRWKMFRAAGLARSPRRLAAYRKFVASMNGLARRNYRPQFFPGTITLFLTTDDRYFKEDRRHLMSHFAEATRVFSIAGNRRNLFSTPMIDELAEKLQAAIHTALADDNTRDLQKVRPTTNHVRSVEPAY